MKDIQMFEAINDGLRFRLGGFLLFLHLNQEPLEVSGVHEPILGVPFEKSLDLGRRFRDGQLEAPAEAEADSVSLFGHRFFPKMQELDMREGPRMKGAFLMEIGCVPC